MLNGAGGLRQQAYASGTLTALPLVLDDGNPGRKVTTSLYCLPPRPLGQCGTGGDQWLLTLVDDRYFWWDKAAAVVVSSGSTTWAQLFAALGAALGVTITADAVPAAYLFPSASFNTSYEFLPPQLDAAARSVGMRVVRGYDGTVRVLGTASAQANFNANVIKNPFVAGGLMNLTTNLASIQPATVPDLAGVLPVSVTVAFPTVDANNAPTGASTAVVTAKTSISPDPYPGAATYNNTHLIRCTAGAGPTNTAEINALGLQIATDWYLWQAARPDIAYNGICNWTPGGYEDRVEFTHLNQAITTRVQRPPWNVRNEAANVVYSTTTGSIDQPPIVNPVFTGTTTFTGTVSFSNTTDNFYGTTAVNYYGPTTYTISQYQLLLYNGPGYYQISAPFEICGDLFLCCSTFTLGGGTTQNFTLPGNVPEWEALGGSANTLGGIKPHVFGVPLNIGPVTGATGNAVSPIVLTIAGGWTAQPPVGTVVLVSNVNGNTAANGTWTVTGSTATTVTLSASSSGNGAFVASPNSQIQEAGPQRITIWQRGSGTLKITFNDAGSDPGNQIVGTPAYGATSVTLAQNDAVTLFWDFCTSFKWLIESCTVDVEAAASGTVKTIFVGTPTTAVTNTVTETSVAGAALFGSKALANSYFSTNGKSIRVKAGGTWQRTLPDTFTIKIKDTANAVTYATVNPFTTSALSGNWQLDATMTYDGSKVYTEGFMALNTTTGVSIDSAALSGNATPNAASQTLDLMIVWSAAQAGDSIICNTCTFEALN